MCTKIQVKDNSYQFNSKRNLNADWAIAAVRKKGRN